MDESKRFQIVILLLTVTHGCTIPILGVAPKSYANTWVERELNELLPVDVSYEEARSILRDCGYDEVLLNSRENDGIPQIELVAFKRRNDNEDIRVTMPVVKGQITKPFRIDWVEKTSGTIRMSETIAL